MVSVGETGIPPERHSFQPQKGGPHAGVGYPQGEKRPWMGRYGLIGKRERGVYQGLALITSRKSGKPKA